METKLSYSCVTPHLMRLRLCGYYQIDPKSPKLQRLFHSIYMRFSLIWIVIYTIQQALKVYEVQEDIDKVIATLFLFLTHTDSIYKQVVLWIKSDKIEELLDIMRGSLYNQDNPEHKPFLLEVARYSLLIVRIDNYLALCTCFLWVLLPLVLHLQGKPVEFGVWLPFDVNVDPVFYFTALYVWGTTSWLAFCNTTIDVLISFFLAQCKTQLSIVRYDLENLIQRSKTESLLTGESHAEVLNKRFRKILLHHAQITYICSKQKYLPSLQMFIVCGVHTISTSSALHILEPIFARSSGYPTHHRKTTLCFFSFVKKVEDIFSFVIIYQFSISGWIICTSVYRMVNMNVFSIQFLSMILYICCMLIEIFMYCYYGNEVTSESTKVMESAYFMNWLSTNTRHRRHLIFFMERIKRPIQISAGVIVPLSNETFISIVKSSYTFYALLKSTSE